MLTTFGRAANSASLLAAEGAGLVSASTKVFSTVDPFGPVTVHSISQVIALARFALVVFICAGKYTARSKLLWVAHAKARAARGFGADLLGRPSAGETRHVVRRGSCKSAVQKRRMETSGKRRGMTERRNYGWHGWPQMGTYSCKSSVPIRAIRGQYLVLSPWQCISLRSRRVLNLIHFRPYLSAIQDRIIACPSGWLTKEFGVPPSGGLQPRERGTPNRSPPFNALNLSANRIGMNHFILIRWIDNWPGKSVCEVAVSKSRSC